MVSTCCAFGCTYRHVTGNTIGLHRFPKDETLRQLWILAIRRSNWKPTPSSRICGKHFQTGKPSKNKHHPDYVPNVFVFNENKYRTRKYKGITVENESQEELLDQFSKTSENVTESDNIEKNIATEVSDNNEKSSIHPSKSPQCVWLFDFASKENNLSISTENETQNNNSISLKNEMKLEISNSIPNCDQVFIPTNEVDADLHDDINSITVANENYASSLTDISRTAFEDTSSINAELYVTDDDSDSAQSFVTTNNDSNLTAKSSLPTIVLLNTESTTATNKTSVNVNVEHASETVKLDPLNSISLPIIRPIKEETTESDYSYFKSSPLDTKEILAIKLETMLAVNISLQEKVKFYRNRCKLYENEINNIANKLKNLKLRNSATFNN